jgi:hypothetical protein
VLYIDSGLEIRGNNMKKANLDWKNLPFGYEKTDFNIRYYYKNGKWSEGELSAEENLSIHMASPCLHYGQEAFEGLKAFETKDLDHGKMQSVFREAVIAFICLKFLKRCSLNQYIRL